MTTLTFSPENRTRLSPYLPPPSPSRPPSNQALQPDTPINPKEPPYITLTYATSLDSQLSLTPGQQTALSGPSSKAMTHYLRCCHDAILVGSGTAIADDPGLNSRLDGLGVEEGRGRVLEQPRPVVLDRRGRWEVSEGSRVVETAREGRGKGPWVVIGEDVVNSDRVEIEERRKLLNSVGGDVLSLGGSGSFEDLFHLLGRMDIKSVMAEGGGQIINSLLGQETHLLSSVIVTIAPQYFGQGGLSVCPVRSDQGQPAVQFEDVEWMPLDRDIVMCTKIKRR